MLLSLLLAVGMSYADQVKVLVVDTGMDQKSSHLCETGHHSFTHESWNKDIEDRHGDNVFSIIERYAGDEDYCVTQYKYYSDTDKSIRNVISALRFASGKHFDIVNLSFTGEGYDLEEYLAVKTLLDEGTVVVAAAGNNGKNLDVHCDVYPACYDPRIIVVGSMDLNLQFSWYTNYSFKKDMIYVCWDLWNAGGAVLEGTSQSTAYATSRLIKAVARKKRLVRKPQSLSQSDIDQIQKAALIQTGMDKKLEELSKKYVRYIPSEVQLVGGFLLPIYKSYVSGMIVIERTF